MTVIEECRPGKTWSELSPEGLIEAVRHLGPDNFGRGGVDPIWLRGFIEQSIGEGGLTPEQAQEAAAIIDRLAPSRKRGTVILK